MKTKENDYQKYFSIKRALKIGSFKELVYNGKIIEKVNLESIMVFAGSSRLEILLTGESETIFADVQDIKIQNYI